MEQATECLSVSDLLTWYRSGGWIVHLFLIALAVVWAVFMFLKLGDYVGEYKKNKFSWPGKMYFRAEESRYRITLDLESEMLLLDGIEVGKNFNWATKSAWRDGAMDALELSDGVYWDFELERDRLYVERLGSRKMVKGGKITNSARELRSYAARYREMCEKREQAWASICDLTGGLLFWSVLFGIPTLGVSFLVAIVYSAYIDHAPWRPEYWDKSC